MECQDLVSSPGFAATIDCLPDEIFDLIFATLDFTSLKTCCVVSKKWLHLINANVLIMRKFQSKITREIIDVVLTLPNLMRQHTNIVLSRLFFTRELLELLLDNTELLRNAEKIDLQACGFKNETCFQMLLLQCKRLKYLTIIDPKINGPKLVTDEIDVELKTLTLEITYCWEYTTNLIRIFQLVPSNYSELNLIIYGHERQKQKEFFEFIHNGPPRIQKALKRLSLLYSCDSDAENTNGVFNYVANMPELQLELFERYASIYQDPGLGDRFIQSQTSLTTLVLQHAEPRALFVTITRYLSRLKKFTFRLKCECFQNVCNCFCQIGLRQLKQLEILSIGWAWTSNDLAHVTDEVVLDFFADLPRLQEFMFDGRHSRFVNLMIDGKSPFNSLTSFVTLDIRIPKWPTWETVCKCMPKLRLLKINDDNNLNEFSFTDFNFGRLAELNRLEMLKLDGILDKENLINIAKYLKRLKYLTIDKFCANSSNFNATLHECIRLLYLKCPDLQNIEMGFIITFIFNKLTFKDLKICRIICKTWFQLINNDVKLRRKFNLRLDYHSMQQIVLMPELFGDYKAITMYDFDFAMGGALKNSPNRHLFAEIERLKLCLMMFSSVEAFHGLLVECKRLKVLDLIEPLVKFTRSDYVVVEKVNLSLQHLFLQFGYGCKIDWQDIFELIPMQASTISLVLSRGEGYEQRKFMEYLLHNLEVQQKLKHLELGYLCDNLVYNDIFEIVSKMTALRLASFTRSQGRFDDMHILNRFSVQQSQSLNLLHLESVERKETLDIIVHQLVNLENLTFSIDCRCNQQICQCLVNISSIRKLTTLFVKFLSCKSETEQVNVKLTGLQYLREFSISGKIQLSHRPSNKVALWVEIDEQVPLEVFNIYQIPVPDNTWQLICKRIPRLKELRLDYMDESLTEFHYNHDNLTGLKNLLLLNLDRPLHLKNDVIKLAEQVPALRLLIFRAYFGGQFLDLEATFKTLYKLCPFLDSVEIGPKAYDRNKTRESFSICDSKITEGLIRAQAFNFVDWDDL